MRTPARPRPQHRFGSTTARRLTRPLAAVAGVLMLTAGLTPAAPAAADDPPAAGSVSPASGTVLGGTQVTVTPTGPYTQVAAGERHSLALADDGTVYAWGYNYSGQLGDGTQDNSNTPVRVQSRVVTGVSFGGVAGTGLRWDPVAATATVVTPAAAAAGVVDVTITLSDGSTQTLTDAYTCTAVATATTLIVPGTATVGEQVPVVATVSTDPGGVGVDAGTVTFTDTTDGPGTVLGTAPLDTGTASGSLAFTASGPRTLVASFTDPGGVHAESTSDAQFIVVAPYLPAPDGQALTAGQSLELTLPAPAGRSPGSWTPLATRHGPPSSSMRPPVCSPSPPRRGSPAP